MESATRKPVDTCFCVDPRLALVLFSDSSAIMAPMLVFTELRDMVSYLIYSKVLRMPRLLREWGHTAPPVLTADEAETDFSPATTDI